MKNNLWRFAMALLIGSGLVFGSGITNVFGSPLPQGRGDHGQGKDHGKKDHGREHMNRGRRMKWERDHDGRYRFDDRDRGEVTGYFRDHRYAYSRERGPRGLHLAYGYVISERNRRYCHPVPLALVRELPPPPRGFRYFLFGGNVVLLDNGYRVQDFIHIGINFGL